MERDDAVERTRTMVDAVYRTESRHVLATLIRILGDFSLAEDALHDAFVAAAEQWPREGVPRNPRAWLVTTGRFKAINAIRRRARFHASLAKLAEQDAMTITADLEADDGPIEDDDLRLIFACCHPALSVDARIALTLREVCGLTTEEIAQAFLVRAATVAQRIVRAKSKIRDAKIPYEIPARSELPDRLSSVLHVVYLVFNEGYDASSGSSLLRADLSREAIRLGRLVVELLPEPEAQALLALMLFHDARRAARISSAGELVLLADQDRSLWDRDEIAEARAYLERARASGHLGPYACQAAIAAVHAEGRNADETSWARIVELYDALLYVDPSPIVELNRAAAIAMRNGAEAGLELIEALLQSGELREYRFAYSARADMHRRLGRVEEARSSYETALALTHQDAERRFLLRRIAELGRSVC